MNIFIYLEKLSLWLVVIFIVLLLTSLIPRPQVFLKKHGRVHSIIGFFYLMLWFAGLFDCQSSLFSESQQTVFDIVFGCAGLLLPLTAAQEFQHKNTKNFASGTLDEHATVTYSEMIEHSFYQGVNIFQIVFLRFVGSVNSFWSSFFILFLVTSPWIVRDVFPVNKFSDNYDKVDERSTSFIRILYRIKKYQYVFYKHFILHGLNISTSLSHKSIAFNKQFRLFWMLLNLSYTMEFFLQTLVKKGHMTQFKMFVMQQFLMASSSLASVFVLIYVDFRVALISLLLNFVHRKHDVVNTLLVWALIYGYDTYYSLL